MPLPDEGFHQERVERAQPRYLAAIKALAHRRRWPLPAIQVKVVEKQIKFAAPAQPVLA